MSQPIFTTSLQSPRVSPEMVRTRTVAEVQVLVSSTYTLGQVEFFTIRVVEELV